jgi:hypothetical protein
MKFELEPYHRDISDDQFIEDIRKVAIKLNKMSVTMKDYAKNGKYHSSSIQRRFGSWFIALEKSGLAKSRSEINIPIEELVDDLKRVSKKLGKESITQKEYREHGKFSTTPFLRRFGSWQATLENNGLKRTRNYKVSDQEYFENIEELWIKFGRQPHYNDMHKPVSKYSGGAYENRFGSWRKALEAFVQYVNQENTEDIDIKTNEVSISSSPIKEVPAISTCIASRSISWRLRFLVMRRDNFKCCACGRSPSMHTGVILHIDHREARSKCGQNSMDNLQTLCEQCNIGKSDLDWETPDT